VLRRHCSGATPPRPYLHHTEVHEQSASAAQPSERGIRDAAELRLQYLASAGPTSTSRAPRPALPSEAFAMQRRCASLTSPPPGRRPRAERFGGATQQDLHDAAALRHRDLASAGPAPTSRASRRRCPGEAFAMQRRCATVTSPPPSRRPRAERLGGAAPRGSRDAAGLRLRDLAFTRPASESRALWRRCPARPSRCSGTSASETSPPPGRRPRTVWFGGAAQRGLRDAAELHLHDFASAGMTSTSRAPWRRCPARPSRCSGAAPP
jgi:hypothetical protein